MFKKGTASLLFTCHCSARCFRAECAEIPRAASAKLHKMQFLCIAKRVTVNNVSSNSSGYCLRASPGRRFETGVHLTETGQRFDELTANFN